MLMFGGHTQLYPRLTPARLRVYVVPRIKSGFLAILSLGPRSIDV